MADDSTSRLPRFPFSRGNVPSNPAPRGSDNDPLAELARLIGHTDPFGANARGRAPAPAPQRYDRDYDRSPDYRADGDHADRYPDDHHAGNGQDDGWPGSPAPAADYHQREPVYRDQDGYAEEHSQEQDQEYAEDYADQPAHYAQEPAAYGGDGYQSQAYQEPPPEASEHAEYGQTAQDGPYYGDNGQLLTDDPYAAEHYGAEAVPPRRRGGLLITLTIVGLVGVGAAGAYGYRTLLTHGVPHDPPLIKADGSPNKIVAVQSADGTANKQIYDRVGGDGSQGLGEKIVSREEQPVDIKAANTRQGYPGAPTAGAQSSLASGWPAPAGTATASPNPGGGGAMAEPRKVKTIPIRPDAGPAGGSPSAQMPAQPAPSPVSQYAQPTPPPAPAPTPAPQPRAAVQIQNAPVAPTQPGASGPPPARQQTVASASNAPLSLSPTATATERVAPAPAAPIRTAPAVGGTGYFVQIAAPRSEADARAAFRSAQARYPNVLGRRDVVVRRKEVAGSVYYGAQVGPFAAREDATQLCDQLKSAGGQCLVQKN